MAWESGRSTEVVRDDAEWGLKGELDVIEHLGDYSIAYVKLPSQAGNIAIKLDAAQAQALQRHQPLRVACEGEHLIAFDAQDRSLAK